MEEFVVSQKPSMVKPWMKFWEGNMSYAGDIDCTVFDYLQKKNAGYDSDAALMYFDRRISYGELYEKSREAAKAYKALGVKKGDIVTLCTVMVPETIYSFYGLDLLGATLNMIDPRTTSSGMKKYIEEVNSDIVLTISAAYEKMQKAVIGTGVRKVIVVSPSDSLKGIKKAAYKLFAKDNHKYDENVVLWPDFVAAVLSAQDVTPEPFDPERAILIVHTGGTTGSPKGVMLGDKGLNALAVQYVNGRTTKRQEKFLNVMPPFIAYGYCVGVHAPITVGCTSVLIPKFEPNELGKLFLKYRPEHMAGVPLHYRYLINDPAMKNFDFSFMFTSGAGGDSIAAQDAEVVNKFFKEHNARFPLTKGYGMTECSAAATVVYKDNDRPGSVGIPLFLTTVSVFKPGTDEELDFDCEGEICICSPTMMLGYYHMPEETAKVIKLHSDGKYWVHSGDIGRVDKDGFVYIVNRIKRVIIRHDGFKVFPFIIEEAVCSVDGVAGACAVAMRDHDHEQGKLPYVFVTVEKDYKGDLKELEAKIRKVCELELAEYVQPAAFEFIDEIPRTNIAKVDFMKLQKILDSREIAVVS